MRQQIIFKSTKKYNVDYIDFRENILKSGIPKDDLFLKQTITGK